MTGSAAEETFPASAAADWAWAGSARPSWSRTAAVTAVEASNAFRVRMAFPSGLDPDLSGDVWNRWNSDASPVAPARLFSMIFRKAA
jgi:hypothetical protein